MISDELYEKFIATMKQNSKVIYENEIINFVSYEQLTLFDIDLFYERLVDNGYEVSTVSKFSEEFKPTKIYSKHEVMRNHIHEQNHKDTSKFCREESINPIVFGANLVNMLIEINRKHLRDDELYNESHLLPYHIQLLSILNKNEKMKISELAAEINVTLSNLSPIIEKMYKLDLIIKKADQNDRRISYIYISNVGIEKLNQSYEIICRNLYSKYSEKTLMRINDLSIELISLIRKSK